jgi:phosphoserine aminotransferase
MPKIFRMTNGGKLIKGIFEGDTINTPSMLCVEDYIDALQWSKALGGLDGLIGRADANLKVMADWVAKTAWVDFLAANESIRSNTSVCIKIVDPAITALSAEQQAAFVKQLPAMLDKEKVAYDIDGYRDAPPGLRIWCGATVEASDVEALTHWLDWAFAKAKADLA